MGPGHHEVPLCAEDSTSYIFWKGAGTHPGIFLGEGRHSQVSQVPMATLSL